MDADLRLYALIDPTVAGGRSLGDLAKKIAGSATLVQLRDKHGSTRVLVEEARALTMVLAPLDIPLIINDRVDVALAAEADGVHIGQDDMSPADARLLLGRTAIIGLSIKTLEQAAAAPLDLLDYVAIGGVYDTSSKSDAKTPIGLTGLREVVQAIRARKADLPICAIAGINRIIRAKFEAVGELFKTPAVARVPVHEHRPRVHPASGKPHFIRKFIRQLVQRLDPLINIAGKRFDETALGQRAILVEAILRSQFLITPQQFCRLHSIRDNHPVDYFAEQISVLRNGTPRLKPMKEISRNHCQGDIYFFQDALYVGVHGHELLFLVSQYAFTKYRIFFNLFEDGHDRH